MKGIDEMEQVKSVKKFGKFAGVLGVVSMSVALLIPQQNEAHAVGSFPYDGLNSNNSNQALSYAKQFSNSDLSINQVKDPKGSGYEAVGRVSNMDGWKGSGKDSMGTGFIVDDHTFITNAHVVETKDGNQAKPQYVKLVTERNGDDKKYTFNAKSIKQVPGADAVVIHTRQNMGRLVEPLKLASEKNINDTKFGETIKSPGYNIVKNGDNTRLWESKGKALMTTSNGKELMNKQIFRSGGSGSPMLTSDNQVLGIMAYGYSLNGQGGYAEADQELSGGFKFTGTTRDFIEKNLK